MRLTYIRRGGEEALAAPLAAHPAGGVTTRKPTLYTRAHDGRLRRNAPRARNLTGVSTDYRNRAIAFSASEPVSTAKWVT